MTNMRKTCDWNQEKTQMFHEEFSRFRTLAGQTASDQKRWAPQTHVDARCHRDVPVSDTSHTFEFLPQGSFAGDIQSHLAY